LQSQREAGSNVRVLVTGGAGFIGSALVRELVEDGHEVRAFDNLSRGNSGRLAGVQCKTVVGDVRDPDTLTRAMWGCDVVAHLAYMQGTQTFYAEPREVLDVAVRGMTNVLEACRVTGCANLLLVSSSEAYQVATEVPTPETVPLSVPDVTNPRFSYGGGKIISELMAMAWSCSGVLDRAVIARPHNVIGPDMGREHVVPEFALRMNRLASEQPVGVIEFPIQGSGQETRSFCWIDDCISQLMLLAARGEDQTVYHVGVEDERTIADVAHAVAACYFRDIKILPGKLPQGSPPRRLPDTRRIQSLGWDAAGRTSFGDALSQTVEWYQANG
jgi:nucleoside-diphosphate-sugar epimerase